MGQDELTVGLLMQDLGQAKEVASVFRQVDIVPHVVQELQTFWRELHRQAPDLAVVDIRLLTDEKLNLKEHPRLKDETLPIVFFCPRNHHPLMFSVYDQFHLGVIYDGLSLQGQVKSILKRFNKMASLKKQQWQKEEKAEASEDKIGQLIDVIQEYKKKDFFQSSYKAMLTRLEDNKKMDSFYSACERVFDMTKEIEKYTFFELSGSGQKLISPQLVGKKFQEIPSLWLGKQCSSGIEFFAQNMAGQVCLELMGGEIISLLIHGTRENPDLLCFIRVESEDFLAGFPWEELERYLSGHYNFFQRKNHMEEGLVEQTMTPWSLYHLLDDQYWGRSGDMTGSPVDASRWSMIHLSFDSLIKTIFSKQELRFFWNRFFNDFINGFMARYDGAVQWCTPGIGQLTLLVERDQFDQAFSDMKSYALRFSIWRYFEDPEVVLGRNLRPDVRSLPMSAFAYHQYLEQRSLVSQEELQEEVEMDSFEESLNPRIWGKRPTQEM